MNTNLSTAILQKLQGVYGEYPRAFWVLMTGTFIDRFDLRWVWYGCSIICAISIAGFFALNRYAGERVNAKQYVATNPAHLAPTSAATAVGE